MNIIMKTVIGIIIFVGLSIATLATCYIYSTTQTEPEIYLMPYGYRGAVVILFDNPNGVAAKYEGDSRVYEIPSDGLLRTQHIPQKTGVISPGSIKFYYVNNDGSRVELAEVRRQEDISDTTLTYIFERSGYGVTGTNSNQKKFVSYMVGTKVDDADKFYTQMQQMIMN